MRCLADLKNRIKPGVTFTISNYIRPELYGDRVVEKAEERGFWYLWPGHEGHGYIEYPHVTLLAFDGESVTFWRETTKAVEPTIMLTFAEEE